MARDLQKDLEICNRATKGPWYVGAKEGITNRLIATTSFFGSGKVYKQGQDANPGADLEFIAEAREGWPEAIERAMKAEAQVKELENKINLLSLAFNKNYYYIMERAHEAEGKLGKIIDSLPEGHEIVGLIKA